jgi:tripartite-type tricarboxylate transporter receptor subunit TctC
MHRFAFARGLAALLLLGFSACACAADYPNRAIHLIVPFAPGGGNDTVARLVGDGVTAELGQPVVVENRPGAGGVVGAEAVARAPADGYTLFLGGVGSHAINPNLHAHLGYDPIKDFAPITLVASAPLVLVVHPSVPAQSVRELVALAKAEPGRLNYASNGNGSSSHLAAVMFDTMTGVEMVHVPYKGLSPALTDLLSGQVQLMFSSVVAILPHVKAGRLRALAVSSPARMALLPDLPTIAESGVPGYQSSSWYGILAPAGTPPDVVKRLNAALVKVIAQPAFRDALAREGAEPVGNSPEAFGAFIKAEKERLGDVIRQARLPMQ